MGGGRGQHWAGDGSQGTPASRQSTQVPKPLTPRPSEVAAADHTTRCRPERHGQEQGRLRRQNPAGGPVTPLSFRPSPPQPPLPPPLDESSSGPQSHPECSANTVPGRGERWERGSTGRREGNKMLPGRGRVEEERGRGGDESRQPATWEGREGGREPHVSVPSRRK